MKKIALLGLVLILIVSSCTIEKRHHLPGYHVQKKYTIRGVEQKVNTESLEEVSNDDPTEEKLDLKFKKRDIKAVLIEFNSRENDERAELDLVALSVVSENKHSTTSSSSEVILNSESVYIKPNKVETDSCDLIMLKDGSEVMGKVTEIGTEEIKYRKCDNLNGPVIVLKKSSVFLIKYPNGTKDVINEIGNEQPSKTDQPSKVKEQNSVSLVLGWLFLLLGIFILLLVSILIGILLVVGGIILIISGMSS